jgi:FAD/FMN-containing dehydrogenase
MRIGCPTVFSSSEACCLPAACIATPRDAKELAGVITILRKYQTKFAVRSGGHKDSPGFASIADGILISLKNFITNSLSKDRKPETLGTGLHWQRVYDYLTPLGLSAVGGRVGIVGVGGFLLGGK